MSTTTIDPASYLNCPCGMVYLPVGSKHNPNGLSARLIYNDNDYLDLPLTHNKDAFLSNQEVFVTTSEKINLNENIALKQLIINCSNVHDVRIFNSINIVVKDFDTKEILFSQMIGVLGDNLQLDKTTLANKASIILKDPRIFRNINLYYSKLQIEFYSLCDIFNEDACCLDNDFALTNKVNNLSLNCCSTTLPPPPLGVCCERGARWNEELFDWEPYAICLGVMTQQQCQPYLGIEDRRDWIQGSTCNDCETTDFCSRFYLPNSFRTTLIGYDQFENQEVEVTVTKQNGQYIAAGYFPCGAYIMIVMTCDAKSETFLYDGLISCCDQSTKWVHDPTRFPLIYPNSRPPQIIGYLNCDDCTDCVETTTTTPEPEIRCDEETITIKGYAFYRKSNRKVNIPGIGDLFIKCAGGHVCNNTYFIPQIVTETLTIDSTPFNLNNLADGGDREAEFTFNVNPSLLLVGGAHFQLSCTDPECHTGVTAIILTANINGVTKLLFNSCVLPDQINELNFICVPYPPVRATYTGTDVLIRDEPKQNINQTYMAIDVLCVDLDGYIS